MKKKKKKTSVILIIILVILLLLVGASLFGIYKIKTSTEKTTDQAEIELVIDNNIYGKELFKLLEDKGLVKDGEIAYYVARFKAYSFDVKAGKYLIDTSKPLNEILTYISDGNNTIQETVRVKLGDGYRLVDFAKNISEETNLSYDELINAWNDEDFVRSLMASYPFITEEVFNDDIKYILEGYLFPDTYEFFKTTTVLDVTKKILDQTNSIYQEYKDLFDNSKYTIHENFALASIIQREANNIDDMSGISSVFHNRLDNGMYLQSSVTVCYAKDIGVNGDWRQCEISEDTGDPYDTYYNGGFPPGPIAAFCKDAIYAALNPIESDYFFFIGDVCGDGKTYFAKTYAEQLQNQARYLTCY